MLNITWGGAALKLNNYCHISPQIAANWWGYQQRDSLWSMYYQETSEKYGLSKAMNPYKTMRYKKTKQKHKPQKNTKSQL